MNYPVNKNKLSYLASAVVIILAGYGLRLLDFTYRSLWFDEAIEYLTASSQLSSLPEVVVTLNYQPPLYSLLLHGWLHLGIYPVWLRYLSIILSIFTLIGVMTLARVTAGQRVGLLAGVFAAIMPTELYYAQDVGEYALMVCCVTWSLVFLSFVYQNNRWRYWILWAVFSVCAVYTHYGAALLIIPLALATLLYHVWLKNWSAVKRQVSLLIVSGLMAIPLLVYFLPQQIKRVSESAFANPIHNWQTEFLGFFIGIADTINFNITGWPFSPIPVWLGRGLLSLLGILVIMSFCAVRKRPFIWFLIAYTFYFLVFRMGLYPTLGTRYSLFFTPLYVLMLAILLDFLWQRHLHIVSALLFCLVLGIAFYSSPHPTLSQLIRESPYWSPGEQMEPVFTYWQSERKPEQPTFVYYSAVPAFRYYLRVYGLDPQTVNAPISEHCSREYRQSLCQEYQLFYSQWIRSYPGEEKVRYILEELDKTPKEFWLIFSHTGEEEKVEVLTLLKADYEITSKYVDDNASVYLMVRKS